jgi:hypothetical protein
VHRFPARTRPSQRRDKYRGLTHPHLVEMLRMRGVIPPLPYRSSWRGAQFIMHDNFTLSIVILLGLGLFFSFLILYTIGRTPWTGDQPVARPLPTHRTTQTQTHKDIHVLSGIRTHDPSIRANEDSSCLRPRGHRDRPLPYLEEALSLNDKTR